MIVSIDSCAFLKGNRQYQGERSLREAEVLYAKGDYRGALKEYRKALDASVRSRDRALFYMGVIYSSPKYPERDYQKSLDAFQMLVKEFPESVYRGEAERVSALLREILSKDRKMKALRKQVNMLEAQIERMKEIDLTIEEKRRKFLQEK